MRLFTLVCAATAFLGPAPAVAQEPMEWLLQISDAAREVSYQGVVVYRDGERMDVMRIVHRQQNGRSQERLTSLNGQPRDILRDGDRVFFLTGDTPAQATTGADPLFPVMSQQLLAKALPHYDYRHLGESRVAGRACRGVLMSPRDDYRYGYEICGDAGTAVPLRVSLIDRRGRTVEQLMFTEIAFPAQIADSAFAPPPGAVSPASAPAPAQQGTTGTWRLATLPPGFTVVRRDLAPAPDGQGVAERVLLSDGISAVSVFGMQPVASARVLSGLFNLGAMSAYGRSIGAFHITVIGDVPPDTVRMIGDGYAAPVEAAAQPASLSD